MRLVEGWWHLEDFQGIFPHFAEMIFHIYSLPWQALSILRAVTCSSQFICSCLSLVARERELTVSMINASQRIRIEIFVSLLSSAPNFRNFPCAIPCFFNRKWSTKLEPPSFRILDFMLLEQISSKLWRLHLKLSLASVWSSPRGFVYALLSCWSLRFFSFISSRLPSWPYTPL